MLLRAVAGAHEEILFKSIVIVTICENCGESRNARRQGREYLSQGQDDSCYI